LRQIIDQLARSNFDHTTPELRDNTLQFYSGVSASIRAKDDKVQLTSVVAYLDRLRTATPVSSAAAVPPVDR
jgi:hypothetical protein